MSRVEQVVEHLATGRNVAIHTGVLGRTERDMICQVIGDNQAWIVTLRKDSKELFGRRTKNKTNIRVFTMHKLANMVLGTYEDGDAMAKSILAMDELALKDAVAAMSAGADPSLVILYRDAKWHGSPTVYYHMLGRILCTLNSWRPNFLIVGAHLEDVVSAMNPLLVTESMIHIRGAPTLTTVSEQKTSAKTKTAPPAVPIPFTFGDGPTEQLARALESSEQRSVMPTAPPPAEPATLSEPTDSTPIENELRKRCYWKYVDHEVAAAIEFSTFDVTQDNVRLLLLNAPDLVIQSATRDIQELKKRRNL